MLRVIYISEKLQNQFYQESVNVSSKKITKEYYSDLEVGENEMYWYGEPMFINDDEVKGLSKANPGVKINLYYTDDEYNKGMYAFLNGELLKELDLSDIYQLK